MEQSQIANLILTFIIALIMFVGGAILKKYPPKERNAIYGYRTRRSMKNMELWNEGNRFSAIKMQQFGILFLIAGGILSLLFKSVVITFLLMGLMALTFMLMFVRVEKRLKEIESDKG
jgi:hypothetical protein